MNNYTIRIDIIENNKYNKIQRYNLVKNINLCFIIINTNLEDKESTITDFKSIESNKNYGSILLKHVINDIKNYNKKHLEKISRICLDDMTERYRQKHNIYIKFGFIYKNNYGPEMILNLYE